jgi:predicted Rossmann fold nucleotide-binding protein DprA/Smf involved in DNA uptake
VGTGLDVVYPASNGALWKEVATQGAVFSESALGTQPHPGVFPARNRIIAALSDVVVVVESHLRGGSLYTAEAAARRSIPVCAVPGSVRSRASEGTNALLVDGCTPVRDATDVLVAISLVRAGSAEGIDPGLTLNAAIDPASPPSSPSTPLSGPSPGPSSPEPASRGAGLRTPIVTGQPAAAPASCVASRRRRARSLANVLMSETERTVWEALDDTPTAFETILIRTDMSVASVAEACDQLVERGLIHSGAGWWSKN